MLINFPDPDYYYDIIIQKPRKDIFKIAKNYFGTFGIDEPWLFGRLDFGQIAKSPNAEEITGAIQLR